MKKVMLLFALSLGLLLAACAAPQDEGLDPFEQDPQQPDPFEDPFGEVEQQIPDVIAEIEGEQISGQELLAMQQQFQAQGVDVSLDEALNQLITYEVLLIEAKERGHQATTEDVESMVESQGLSIEQLREILENQGQSYEQFLEEQKRDAKLNLLITEISQNIQINSDEAIEYFENQAQLFAPNATYEESKDAIKEILVNQRVSLELENLANIRIQDLDVQVFI
ncbi:MAG: hypothetical protein ACMXX6_01955 [Candidatus Woesearchaeota archaeon]